MAVLKSIARLFYKAWFKISDICWEFGFLPLPVHYYSPVPSKKELREFDWTSKSSLVSIPFDEASQINILKRLSKYSSECIWPEHRPKGRLEYYSQNPSFGFSSACLLYTMIREFKPSNVIEVGGGFSTFIICQSLQVNSIKEGKAGSVISIDPFPNDALRAAQEKYGICVRREPVQRIPVALFEQLQAGDLLFIDTSHVVRIGGDVNFLILEVLPRLHPGVLVHLHDIYLPYEYPRSNYFSSGMKLLWTEQYLLHAFLCFNTNFKILVAAYWLQMVHSDESKAAFPSYDSKRHRPSSSFYIQRVQ